jgi:hypothetical protein
MWNCNGAAARTEELETDEFPHDGGGGGGLPLLSWLCCSVRLRRSFAPLLARAGARYRCFVAFKNRGLKGNDAIKHQSE